MDQQKQKEQQEEELTFKKMIGNLMTRTVNLSKDEYCDMLREIGLQPKDVDKVDENDRLCRIRSNYYGTSINMMFSLLQEQEALREEVATTRALLNAICKKVGIEVEEIKTSADRVNEAAAAYLDAQTKAMKQEK